MMNPNDNYNLSSAPQSAPDRKRSVWKPLFITFFASAALALLTCSGGFAAGKGPSGIGSLLLYAGLMFFGICVLTFVAIVVYFLAWIIRKLVS